MDPMLRLESLRKSSIRLVLTRHEQAAGFMASTFGRLTGKCGVCLATLGPGATNLVTAAAYAQLGAMPMLMLTGQKPIRASKQGEFQILNVVEDFGNDEAMVIGQFSSQCIEQFLPGGLQSFAGITQYLILRFFPK